MVYQKFHSLKPFYLYPVDSTLLGVYKVTRLHRTHSVAKLSEIVRKYVLLCIKDADNDIELRGGKRCCSIVTLGP